MKYLLFLAALTSACSSGAQKLQTVNYQVDGQAFTAYYAMPAKITAETKTILIVHEWWGLNDYPKSRALKIAEEGNIAFCVDMYGDGKHADNPTDAQALASPFYENPEMAYMHFMAAYDEAIKLKGVNKDKMAAIGYCFGGSMVLNAAKMGAPLDAVISFHGGLAGIPVDKEKLKASVLVCNGAADEFVSAEEIAEFKKQMEESAADMTFIDYADATHAFTNAASTAVGKKFKIPIAYNEAADKKSWEDYTRFLTEKVK